MKDLGDVYLILGMQVSRDRLKGTLEGNYVNTILQRYGFVDSKSVRPPGTGKPLDLKLGTLLDDSNKQVYQEIVEVSSIYRRVHAGTLLNPYCS